MLTLTEIFLKARSGVYANTPENRRLGRVGQRYGVSEQRMQQEQDERLARRRAQERVSDQQYVKAQELLSALKKRGLDEFYISRSITDFGVSTYVQGYGLKFRISDHSVTNSYRIMNEDFFTYDSDVEELADYAKEHYDAIQERARKREEEMNRRRQKEQELDNYWESISGGFDGKVFGENRRTYAKPDEFAAKHPEWTDIYAVDLGGGAYSYEWIQQKNGYGRVRPSYAWLEWHRKEHEIKKSVFRNLTERYLMKSYKYIRREWRNGRWKYWYDDVKDKFVRGRYGQIFRGFVGDPRQAFKALFRRKTGQAYDVVKINLPAIDIDENGRPYQVYQVGGEPLMVETSIDMVWGDADKGLKHILLRHFVQQNDFSSIKNAEDVLTYNLIRFQKDPSSFEVKFNERNGTYELLNQKGESFVISVEVSKDLYGNQIVRHFILTSYDSSRSKNSKIIEDENVRRSHYEQISQTNY